MPFRITARTVLELGAELISSDAIALYELIKNSIDAGSETVDIRVYVTFTHSNYDIALERLSRDEGSLSDAKEWILNHVEESAPQDLLAEFEDQVAGAKSKKSLATMLSQAYEACNFIEVEDYGHGMSLKELDDIYLTIGTRSRYAEKSQLTFDDFDSQNHKSDEKIYLGEKGIGRLSAMRLGERLEIETTRSGEANFNCLSVDWRDFGHDVEALLQDVPVEPVTGKRKKKKSIQGTTVTISYLKGDWTERKFQAAIDSEFARLVDPFESRRANRILKLSFNGESYHVPEVPKRLLENAHAWAQANFRRNKKSNELEFRGEVHYPLRGDWTKKFSLNETELVSILSGVKLGEAVGLPLSAINKLGRFSVHFYWFNRRILTEIAGLGTRRDVQNEVRRWAGGLMLFRDGFRVNPYGGPDDDWLGLDKRALGAKAYKVNRSQLIGGVNITWRNKFLVDQTNREGLVDTAQKEALRRLLLHLLIQEFRPFLEYVDEEYKAEHADDLDTIEQKIESAKSEVERRILILAEDVPQERDSINELHSLTNQLVQFVDEAKEAAQHYEDDRAKFVHLAGIGLMVEFILHELGRASSHALGILQELDHRELPRREVATLTNLSDQLKTLQKRVDTLDPLSTSRRQRKETFDICRLVADLIESHSGETDRHQIQIEGIYGEREKLNVKAVKGMVVQIIENLLTNSLYWLKAEKKVNQSFRPKITIEINDAEKTIAFSDNGRGVAQEEAETVFQAFVSRKPPGEGKGLGLYISREIAEYHDWQLYLLDAPTKKTGRLNTFLLDLS